MEALSLPEASRCPGPLVSGLRRPRGHADLALQNAEDERLTGLAAAGEEAAFEILYERYSAAILRYLRRRMRSAEEAEDVHQQVFLSAFSALRAGVEPLHFKAWLYRIAHNVCVSELRVQRPVTGSIEDERGLACLRADAGPSGREDLRQLLDDLALLPRAQSSALLLREVHDLSYAEIGDTLHVPVGAVRSNIFRARASLHALAAARDVDCSEIRMELERLAGRRGRRNAHIANHLRVCESCQDYRRGLRRRPVALSLLPLVPLSWQRALFGSPATESTTGELAAVGIAAGGVAAGVKLAAVASVVAISVTGAIAPGPEPDTGRDVARAVTAPAFAGPQLPAPTGAGHTPDPATDPAAVTPVSGLGPGADPQRAVGINLPVPAAQQPVGDIPVADQPPKAVAHPPKDSTAPVEAAPKSAPGDAGPAAPAPAPTEPGGSTGPTHDSTSGTSGPAPAHVTQPGTSSGTGDGQTQTRTRNRSGSSDGEGTSTGTGSAEEREAAVQEPAPEAPAEQPAAETPPAEQPAEQPAPEQTAAEQQTVEQPPAEQQPAAAS